MKTIITFLLLLLTATAFGELTKEDLRTIIKEEVAASEKRMKEYIDLKIDGVEKSLNARIDALEESLNTQIDDVDEKLSARIDDANGYFNPFGNLDPFWIAMVMIVSLIILPQLIILYKEIRDRKKNWTQIQELRERIEALSQ